MLAYTYDEITKEYKFSQEAQEDPVMGGYLLPANSTFKEPPGVSDEQIQVFEKDNWVIKVDKRNTWQVKLDDITFSKVDYIGKVKKGYQFITDEVYEDYQSDPDKYKVISGVFTDISDTQEYKDIKTAKRKASFEASFLSTSLGNYRLVPKGYANAQQSVDTINNMVNVLGSFTEAIAAMMLFYPTPDFTKPEECTEEWLIQHQYSAEPMTKEAWQTYYVEFTTKYAQKMYQQELLAQKG